MGAQILHFIVDTVCAFFCIALLARFTLQTARVPFRNPVGQFVMAVTDWLVLPARRFVPAFRGYDTASLLLAWVCQLINMSVATAVTIVGLGLTPGLFGGLALLALIETAKVWLYLVMGVVFISAIFSWVNPHAPMAGIFNTVSRPWLRPFQRLIPLVGGVDLSPLALIVLVQVGLMVLTGLRYATLPLLYS